MDELTYWVYANDQPVTNATGVVITHPEVAKRAAIEISEAQPEETIWVKSISAQASGEWVGIVARFQNGRELPWQWHVEFDGYLEGSDHELLSRASIFYEAGGPSIGPNNELRSGMSRHVVSLEAQDGNVAIRKVQAALGAKARKCSEWKAKESWPDNPPLTAL